MIMYSDNKASSIFELLVFGPRYFLRSSMLLGGKTLWAGVTYSTFKISGHTPSSVAELKILLRGEEKSTAYSRIILLCTVEDFFFRNVNFIRLGWIIFT